MHNSRGEIGLGKKRSTSVSSRALSKTIDEIFIRFSSALRTAQIYEPNNQTFIGHIHSLFSLLENILSQEGGASFRFQENTLFFNNTRIKFDLFSYNNFKFLADEFREKDIGAIGFEPGLSDKELSEFIVLLANPPENKEASFEDISTQLISRGITHIFLERIHPYDAAARMKAEKVKPAAKKVFFRSIKHLKESFENNKENQKLQLKTTRRLIQAMVDLISRDESFMIGMTNIKNYDDYTVNHSTNVAVLSLCFGRRLGLDKEELTELGLSAFFHDIGKLDIPEEILDKKDKLSEEERKIMEKHTLHGVEKLLSLKDSSFLPVKTLYVVLEHHLWANLSGYPNYWKRNKISLYSKIVKICDFFDSVTTERPYRDYVLTWDQALSLMLEKSGTEFDPVLLKVFASMVGVYPIGSLVALNTEELGIVMEANPEVALMLRPKVKLITDRNGKKIDGEIIDLTEMNPTKGEYKRSIVKSLDPRQYNIQVADYFLAQEN
ncbi:MAG: HD domain-containing protein [Candidatus Aminicenantes bacterium]|nr:HD domain-containing protein [Candidatus Aminicenantes bacterium]